MFKILGAAMILTVSAVLLKSFGWNGAPIFAAVAALLLLGEAAKGLFALSLGGVFSEYAALLAEPIGAALKILGLGYLFGICSDICRELGEASISRAVEVAGRVEIVAVIIPFFEEILKVAGELLR